MRRLKAPVLLLATATSALLLLVSACGDKSTGSSSPTTVDRRSATQLAADKAGAETAILKLSDLPPGWTAQPSSPDSERSAEQRSAEAEFAECADVDPSVIGAGSSSVTRAKSEEFSDDGDHQVEGSVTVIATREAAKAQLSSIRKKEIPGCLANFVNRAIKSAIKNPKAGESAPTGVEFGDAKVETLNLPGLHATSVGYRTIVPVRAEGRSVEVNLDIVLALSKRSGISMTFTSFGPPFDSAVEVELTNKVIDRAPPD